MRISDSQLSGYVNHESQQTETKQQTSSRQQSNVELNAMQRVAGHQESVDLSYYYYYQNEDASRLYSQTNIIDPDSGEQLSITQEELTHSLVSGILEQNIRIADVLYAPRDSSIDNTNTSFIQELGLQISAEDQAATSQTEMNIASAANNTASTTDITVSKQQLLESNETLTLVSEGEIVTDDGRSISFRLELDLDHHYTELTSEQLNVRSQDLVDPLVISLNGRAPSLSSSTFSFDIDSDGQNDKLSQLASGAGFLAIDHNQDGVINNGQELFGTQSGNAYADLAVYDGNNDGWIDEADEVYEQLLVWQPGMTDSEAGSLVSLKDAAVGAISLQALESPFAITDDHNNTLGMIQRSGVYLKESGEAGLIQQIDLVIQPSQSELSFAELSFSEQSFEKRANELEQRFQQHLADNEGQVFQRNLIDIDVDSLSLNGEEIQLSDDAQPILLVARQVQFDSQLQENTAQYSQHLQQSSFRQTTLKSYEATPEEAVEQPIMTLSTPEFSVSRELDYSHNDSAQLKEEDAIKNSIIEGVLKPLYEQLKLQRQRAAEKYDKYE